MARYTAPLLLSLSAVLVHAQDSANPVINTPTSLVQCLPALISFSGGTPPYYLSGIPAGQTGAAALVDLGQSSANSLTWYVDVPQQTALTLQVRDTKGLVNYSQAVTVQDSNNSTCVKVGPHVGAVAPGPGTTTPPTTSTAPTTATTPSTSGTTTPSTNTSTPPSNSGSTTPSTGSSTTSGSSSTQTKGPSPFVANTTNNASTGARSGTASSSLVINKHGMIFGLAVVGLTAALCA